MQDSPRSPAASLVLAATLVSILAWVSAVAFWADRSVAEESAFRSNALTVMEMDSSQAALAARLVDEAVDALPLLAFVRGAGERAVVVLLDSGAFNPTLERLVAEGHRHILSGVAEPFVADLTDVRAALVAPIAELAPDLADRIPVDVFQAVVIFDSGALPVVGRTLRWLPAISVLTAAAAVLVAVAAIVLSRRRSVALFSVAAGVAFAGLGVAAWSALGGTLASARIEDELTRALVENGFTVVAPALRVEGLGLMGAGVILAFAGLVMRSE